jgi:hypothetical protein
MKEWDLAVEHLLLLVRPMEVGNKSSGTRAMLL